MIPNADGPAVAVLLNTTVPNATAPTFAAPVDHVTAGGSFAVAIGDLDADGRLDLVVPNSSVVSILLGR